MPPLKCPECGSAHVVEAVAEWSARSLEPTDTDNTGILLECQCADCGRSLWLGNDWFASKIPTANTTAPPLEDFIRRHRISMPDSAWEELRALVK